MKIFVYKSAHQKGPQQKDLNNQGAKADLLRQYQSSLFPQPLLSLSTSLWNTVANDGKDRG